MTGQVVIDEWTLMVRGDAALPAAAANQLRELVDRELRETVRRIGAAIGPTATIELLP